MCFAIFSTTLCETFLIRRRIQRDFIALSFVNLSDFNETRTFLTDIFSKNTPNQISLNTVQLEPICSMRTDGWTDMTKLIVAFRNFAKAPENRYSLYEKFPGFHEMWNWIFRSLVSHALATTRLFYWWCARIAVCVCVLGRRDETCSTSLSVELLRCAGVCAVDEEQ